MGSFNYSSPSFNRFITELLSRWILLSINARKCDELRHCAGRMNVINRIGAARRRPSRLCE